MSSWFRLKVLRLVKGVSVERCSGGLSCVQGSRCSWDVDSCGFVYLGLNLWDDNYFFPPPCGGSVFHWPQARRWWFVLSGVLSCFKC